jgi:hypothetical protein
LKKKFWFNFHEIFCVSKTSNAASPSFKNVKLEILYAKFAQKRQKPQRKSVPHRRASTVYQSKNQVFKTREKGAKLNFAKKQTHF